MSLNIRLNQDATVWSSTPNGFGGYSFGAPTAVKCRWEDMAELIQGSTEMSKAVIYVSQDIAPEDYILLGTSEATDPTTVDASRVLQFQKIPDLRNLSTIRKAWL